MGKKEINNLIISSLEEVLFEQDEQGELQINYIDESTSLIGSGSVLDSLGLVNLIVNIEERLNEDLGIEVTIADERALSQKKSPFRTVGRLSEYLGLLIKEQERNG